MAGERDARARHRVRRRLLVLDGALLQILDEDGKGHPKAVCQAPREGDTDLALGPFDEADLGSV